MTQIKIGDTGNGKEVFYNYIPKDSRGILISAVTRSGKTTLVFELIKRFKSCDLKPQIVIISKEGEEVKLRDTIPFILVGNDGEIPIDPKLAKQMGEKIRKSGFDIIVDITSIKIEKEQDRFIADFIDGLSLDGEQKFWEKPCILFIDEVQLHCNSSKTSLSRDMISILAQTCLKRNILPIFASHSLKDVYNRTRDELTNHIIGFIDNPIQREYACELLDLKPEDSDKIKSFRETKGMFFVEGSDITIPAQIIKVNASKLYTKTDYTIPKLSFQDRQHADALRQSLDIKENISIETQLRFENTSQKSKIDELSETQMTEKNVVKFREEGFMIGYNKAIDDTAKGIEDARPTGLVSLIKHGPQFQIVKDGWRKRLVIQ